MKQFFKTKRHRDALAAAAPAVITTLFLLGTVATLIMLLRGTPQERFDECMAVAAGSDELKEVMAEAAIVCLENATAPRELPSDESFAIHDIERRILIEHEY